MKKILSIAIAVLTSLAMIVPAYADSTKVVTIGVDISDAQEESMLKYFGVSRSDPSVDIIYVNNQQERDYLGAYVPLEQIGNKTFSCAYVKPTTSGGIKVKTANLNWVTCNMIATTLSTSGVKNCQVIAAAPIEVSGTGALTGIIIAYQQASGETLDPDKVDLANREMVVTADLSDQIGSSNAIAVVNETKLQVIENNVTNTEEITNIVNNITNEYNIEIDNSQTETIVNLVSDIAAQDYEPEAIVPVLSEVQANVIEDTNAPEEVQIEVEERQEAIVEEQQESAVTIEFEDNPEVVEEENILDNTDASALETEDTPIVENDTMSTVTEQETTDISAQSDDEGWEVFNFEDTETASADETEDITSNDEEWYVPDYDSETEENSDDEYFVPDYENEETQDNEYFVPDYENESSDIVESDTEEVIEPEETIPEEIAENETEQVAEGWIYNTEITSELPEDVQTVFDLATEGLLSSYTPVALLDQQVVAGMNYRILCIKEDPEAEEKNVCILTIYADLDGNASITDETVLDLDELRNNSDEADNATEEETEEIVGGWELPKEVAMAAAGVDSEEDFDISEEGWDVELIAQNADTEVLLTLKKISDEKFGYVFTYVQSDGLKTEIPVPGVSESTDTEENIVDEIISEEDTEVQSLEIQ